MVLGEAQAFLGRTVVAPPAGAKAKGADLVGPAGGLQFTVSRATGTAGCAGAGGGAWLWAGTCEIL